MTDKTDYQIQELKTEINYLKRKNDKLEAANSQQSELLSDIKRENATIQQSLNAAIENQARIKDMLEGSPTSPNPDGLVGRVISLEQGRVKTLESQMSRLYYWSGGVGMLMIGGVITYFIDFVGGGK